MKIIKISMPMIRKDQLPQGFEIKKSTYGDDTVTFRISNGKINLGKLVIVLGMCPETFEHENIWYVCAAMAEKGYGPLLYDEALRHVTDLDGYLISHEKAKLLGYDDIGKTSPDAQKVWDYYRTRSDVEETEKGFRFRSSL